MLQVELSSQNKVFRLAKIHPESTEKGAVELAFLSELREQVSLQKVGPQLNPFN